MSEQNYLQTLESQMIDRMAQRIGVLIAQVDMLQLQLEAADRQILELRQHTGPMFNGESQEEAIP